MTCRTPNPRSLVWIVSTMLYLSPVVVNDRHRLPTRDQGMGHGHEDLDQWECRNNSTPRAADSVGTREEMRSTFISGRVKQDGHVVPAAFFHSLNPLLGLAIRHNNGPHLCTMFVWHSVNTRLASCWRQVCRA